MAAAIVTKEQSHIRIPNSSAASVYERNIELQNILNYIFITTIIYYSFE